MELARAIIDFLRTRYHTEAPHISTLSPDSALAERVYLRRPTISQLDQDLDPEVLADLLDPYRIRGHSVFGVAGTFREWRNESELLFGASFYYRVAPPLDFRRCLINIRYDGERNLHAEINIGRLVRSVTVSNLTAPLLIAIGIKEIAGRAAEILNQSLYGGAAHIEYLDDPDLLDSLSTNKCTSDGRIFYIYPTPRRRQRISSTDYRITQNLVIEILVEKVEEGSIRATFVLRYVCPVLTERKTGRIVSMSSPYFFVYVDRRYERWSAHHLMEVDGFLEWNRCRPAWAWSRFIDNREIAGLHGLMPIGCIATEDKYLPNRLLLRDWNIDIEEIPEIEGSPRDIEESFTEAANFILSHAESVGVLVDGDSLKEAASVVCAAFKRAFPEVRSLYLFQEESLRESLFSLISEESKAIVLQARTAGGKTLAFLLPILIWIAYLKISGKEEPGVKAILMYPTTALQNDQSRIIFTFLWHMNTELSSRGYDTVISMGILQRYTPRRYVQIGHMPQQRELRLKCPVCQVGRMLLDWSSEPLREGDEYWVFREQIICANESCRLNSPDPLIQRMCRMTREAIYESPPDLLIANPDIINARLNALSKIDDPGSLTILGKEARICPTCGMPHAYPARKCKICGERLSSQNDMRFSYPKVIVIDEAHQMRGAFGAQASHLLTRLEESIRFINNLSSRWRPLYFVSSATLNDPIMRAAELTAFEREKVQLVPARPTGRVTTYRVHVFLMPKVYSPEATAARIFECLYVGVPSTMVQASNVVQSIDERLQRAKQRAFGTASPATLAFANTIAEVNVLLGFTRRLTSGQARIDGHSTDYAEDRREKEDGFSRGDYDALIATSGLEVGVDFDRVNVGMIYRMPFYITDYTQRIGRIGRRQHCLIFNIFVPDSPVDYFYFRNWKLLCDGNLRDTSMRNEAYRVDRNNIETIRRSARRAVIDFVTIQPEAEYLLHESVHRRIRNRTIFDALQSLLTSQQLLHYVRNALRVERIAEATREAQRFAQVLLQSLQVHRTLMDAIRVHMVGLKSLRTAESEVEYRIEMERRPRSLCYAFRRCVPGQIISYRGLYFAVDTVQYRRVLEYPQEVRGERE